MARRIICIIIPLVAFIGLWLFGERWRPLRRSTWKGMRAIGWRNLFTLKTVHAYIYGRWTNQYINLLINYIIPRTNIRHRQHLADNYHGKVLTAEQAQAIITLNLSIPLRDLDQIIPYPMARNLVLNGPPEIAVYECPCRHASVKHCQPTQVCMIIGQPFVDFVLEHNPQNSRRLTQDEALEVLKGERERGHVHSAWFKDVAMDRFFAICNCCQCCCAGIKAMTRYGIPALASSGYVCRLDRDLCLACGICVRACSFGALSLEEEGGLAVNGELCMGCGVCVEQCPHQALTLVRDERKGMPLDIRMLAQEHTSE